MRSGLLAAVLLLGAACDPPINNKPTMSFTRPGFGGARPADDVQQRIDTPVTLAMVMNDPERADLEVIIEAVDPSEQNETVELFRGTFTAEEWGTPGAEVTAEFYAAYAGAQIFEATVFDGVDYSAISSLQAKINGPPSTPVISLALEGGETVELPSPDDTTELPVFHLAANLSATAILTTRSEDPNGDTVDHQMHWRVEGGTSGPDSTPSQTSLELPSGWITSGETWTLSVDWSDGGQLAAWPDEVAYSFSREWAVIQIDTPAETPTIPVVQISPSVPHAANALECVIITPSTTTGAGEVPEYAYTWTVAGVVRTDLTQSIVPSGEVEPGTTWECTAHGVTAGGVPGEDAQPYSVDVLNGSGFQLPSPRGREWLGDASGAGLGSAAARFDLNGDGVDELLVGEPDFSNITYPDLPGRLSGYTLSTTTPGDLAPNYRLIGLPASGMGRTLHSFELPSGKPALVVAGNDIAGVLVGAPTLGTGSETLVSSMGMVQLVQTSNLASLGQAVASGPFFDPARNDLALTQRGANTDAHAVWVVSGVDIDGASGQLDLASSHVVRARPEYSFDWGRSIDLGGNPTGAGPSLVIGTPGAPNATFALVGTASDIGTDAAPLNTLTPLSMDIGVQTTAMGWQVLWLGDVTGNGYDDLLVSDPMAGNNAGALYVFEGWGSGAAPGSDSFKMSILGDPGSRLGDQVRAVGDLNGDGLTEVLVSAPGVSPEVILLDSADLGRDGIFMGGMGLDVRWLVANDAVLGGPVGDLTGDGLPDVFIGEPSNGSSSAGAGRFFIVDSLAPWGI